jgi:hypothetical protein
MSQPGALLASDPNEVDKAVEENYTKKYLDNLSEAADILDDEYLSPYALFYLQNNEVGYAFYVLACIFKKIDALIDVSNKADQSPWEYFSSQDSFVKFSRAIETLTERVFQGTTEPPIIEQIRKADRSRMRRVMLKRITDLEPARITFDREVLEHLIDRNSFFDDFLKVIYIKRGKKQSPDATGKNEHFSHLGTGLTF